MRAVAALVFVLSFPALALGQTPVSERYLIVPGQGIGPVRLGMTIAQVAEAYRVPITEIKRILGKP